MPRVFGVVQSIIRSGDQASSAAALRHFTVRLSVTQPFGITVNALYPTPKTCCYHANQVATQ
jgi:hypothetical protein